MSLWIDRDAESESRRIFNVSRMKRVITDLLNAVFTQVETDLEYFNRSCGNLPLNATISVDRSHECVIRDGEASARTTVRVDFQRFKLTIDRSSGSVRSETFDLSFPNETAEFPSIWNGPRQISIPEISQTILRSLLFPWLIAVEQDPRGPAAPSQQP